MFKKIILSLVSICLFSQINAQFTDYKTSVWTDNILIEDNYLYFTDLGIVDGENSILVKRIDLVEGLPSETVVTSFEYSGVDWPAGLAKNGEYIYCGSNYFAGAIGEIFKLDITGASEPESLFSSTKSVRESDMVYRSNYLYRTEYSSFNVVRENVSLTPPLTSSVYLNFDGIARPRSLHIDGSTLYIGLKNGDIYTKSLFFAGPATLLYSNPTDSSILDLIKFDGYIYYSNFVGIHRFDPLAVSPIAETITGTDVFSNPIGIAAKAFDSGDKFLYVSEWNTKIVRIDLNDISLSINETIFNRSVIYPNPTTNTITIKSPTTIKHISVYDLLGKQVLEFSAPNQILEYNLDISILNSGVYNLKIKTELGTETKKIIKN